MSACARPQETEDALNAAADGIGFMIEDAPGNVELELLSPPSTAQPTEVMPKLINAGEGATTENVRARNSRGGLGR